MSRRRTTTVAMCDATCAIHKFKPTTIRVVHEFAPRIIKTDAANFRQLVQRLTGNCKPTAGSRRRKKTTMTEDYMATKPTEGVKLRKKETLKRAQDEEREQLGLEMGSASSSLEFVAIDGFLQEHFE